MSEEKDAPKYPRTRHLPWSEEVARDDKYMTEEELKNSLLVEKPVVVTEKMDGSNTCLTRDKVYARSHGHEAEGEQFDLLKQIHSEIGRLIPPRFAVYGEWMYAKHSIHYTELPTPFLVFGVLDTTDMKWLSWGKVEEVAAKLGLDTTPRLTVSPLPDPSNRGKGIGSWPEPEGRSRYGDTREGYVVRVATDFRYCDFPEAVGKAVREGHVTTDDHHWKTGEIETNRFNEIRRTPEATNQREVADVSKN